MDSGAGKGRELEREKRIAEEDRVRMAQLIRVMWLWTVTLDMECTFIGEGFSDF